MNIKLLLNFIITASWIFLSVGCVKFSEADRQKILINKQLSTQEKEFFEIDDSLKKMR